MLTVHRTRSAVLAFVAATLLTGSSDIAAAARRAAAGPAQPLAARVVGVADGDTLTVLYGGQPVKVRVEGVDCPERGQPFGTAAKRFTSEHTFGKVVELRSHRHDRYGRLVSRVLVGKEDLGLALLAAGLAWHYTQYSNDSTYAQAEQAARTRHVGLWSQKAPVPPWVQRRPGARIPAAVPSRAAPAASAGVLRGNVKSKVFHGPGCPNYRCRQCTATFGSPEEALAQGFRPAGDCQGR